MTSSKPAVRYRDIRRNIEKMRDYLARGGGLEQVLSDQGMPYDAVSYQLERPSATSAERHEPSHYLHPVGKR